MPRGSSGSNKSGGGKSSPSPVRQSTVSAQPPIRQAPAPAPAQTHVQQQQRGGMFANSGSGIGQTIATGMALGAGSALGHEAVRAVSHGLTGYDNHNNHHHQQYQNDDQTSSMIGKILVSIAISGAGYFISSKIKQVRQFKKYAVIPGVLYGIYSLNE